MFADGRKTCICQDCTTTQIQRRQGPAYSQTNLYKIKEQLVLSETKL